jgi:hypothetical protein
MLWPVDRATSNIPSCILHEGILVTPYHAKPMAAVDHRRRTGRSDEGLGYGRRSYRRHHYYLAKAGFEVSIVDRQAGVALKTSFANAGEISPGYASPWAGPGVPLKAIQGIVVLERIAADDTGWTTHHRTNAVQESASQHRQRNLGLDDGLRRSPDSRRLSA